MREVSDYLPLSFLNQFVYCPRRFWLMYVQKEWEVNAAVLEGTLRHQHAHQTGTQTDEHGRTLRSLYLWNDKLQIAGFADFIQEREGLLIPLEHKRGRMGKWLNDHVQVCAQALCLEERLGLEVPYGEIFYWANRRREQVVLDDALRAATCDVIQRIHGLLEAGRLPAPIDHSAKCLDCSLEPVCLPRETLQLLREDSL
jgi:CRISPR-associated exonuclease Cas4